MDGNQETERVGIVGASARAAAMSLARAGFAAWAIDLFADRDLRGIAPCVRCPLAEFPAAIPTLAQRLPSGPFLYTGGLENHPEVIRELARRRPLWGNGPEVLQRVRDPFQVANELRQQPELLAAGSMVPGNGRWLLKSLRSSGGLGVRFAEPGEIVPAGSYLQEFVSGPSMSALYWNGQLFGITEQLIGTPWLHAHGFLYAGTIGAIEASSELRSNLAALGERLVDRFGLTGVFGVDFILHDGRPQVIEINPRYPASVEVLEHALGIAILANGKSERQRPESSIIGKAIYFAKKSFRFPEFGPWNAEFYSILDPWILPRFADIPEAGEPMDAGSPVLTFFVAAPNTEKCRLRLQSQAAELDHLFFGPERPGS